MPPGWQPQPESLATAWMDRFADQFRFHPDVDPSGWPSIAEPTPSLTLDLAKVGPIPEADEAILDLFVAAFPRDARLIAINYNHYCHWFRPHEFARADRPWPAAWWVHPYPNGDYSIFLTEDLAQGTFGHPWEETLCVFGQPLIKAVQSGALAWPIKRQRTGA